MPSIMPNFTSSLQLAREAATLLEHTHTCRRRAAHLNNVFTKLASFLEPQQNADIDFIQVEASLRNIISLLREFFDPSDDRSTIILQLMDIKRATQVLADVEQRLQTLIQVCRIRFEFPSPPAAIEQIDLDDAEEDHLRLENMIKQYQDEGHDQVEAILLLLKDHPDISLTDIIAGRAGTRRQRRALQELISAERGTQESEMATIPREKVTIDYPEHILGEGSFGQVLSGVLEGEDGINIPVAIKRVRQIRGHLQLSEQKALIEEAQSWQGLNHKNIVCLLGTCIIQNRFHLVMDKCDFSLDELLYESKPSGTSITLGLDDKEAILRGVTRGLRYLHSENVIHGDLEPANVLLSQDLGLVKLTDFGLADRTSPNTSFADTISVAGTRVYMAPEVLQAPARWTTKADIYSLGLIMWEMYHEETPYEHLVYHPGELESRVLAGERPEISDEVPVKLWIVRIMKSCWDEEPANRPTAKDILKSFESRGGERRSSRIIRGLAGGFIKRIHRTSAKRNVNVEMVRGLLRDLADRGDRTDLLRTLQSLHDALKGEFKAAETVGGDDALRRVVRERGILVHLHRILKEEQRDAEVISEALWIFHYAFHREAFGEYTKAAMERYGIGPVVLSIMQEHASETAVQAAACACVRSLAYSNTNNAIVLAHDLYLGAEIVAAMRVHRTNANVQEQACGALRNLAFTDRNREILGQYLNVGTEIVAGMRAHRTNANVQEQACAALNNLAENDRNREILVQDLNVGAEIVAAMRAPRMNANVQEQACVALCILAVNARNQDILVQDLNVGIEIAAAMRAHPTNAEVQRYACAALESLALNERKCESLLQELNVGARIVAAMRAHQANAEIQRYACGALWSLAANDRNKERLGQDLNAGAEIVVAMREHGTNANVQISACGALMNIADNDRNRKILGQDLNVGAEIVTAMRAHPTNTDVQRYACLALWSLANNEQDCESLLEKLNVGLDIVLAMRVHLTNAGVKAERFGASYLAMKAIKYNNAEIQGAEIVTTMREHGTNADVQIIACWALMYLALDDRNREILGQDLNVGAEIVAVMRTHRTNANVQEEACLALSSYIALSNDWGYEFAQNLGATIVDAMVEHRTNAGVQERACEALRNLSFKFPFSKIDRIPRYMIKRIVAAMREHRTNANVQVHACAALGNFAAQTDRDREILEQELNVGTEIVAAMREHRTNADVQEQACETLRILALNERNREILGQDLNAGAEIVAAMRAHPTNACVQAKACEVLCILVTCIRRNREILGEDLNAGAEIMAAMRAHPTNVGVQENACKALGSLAVNKRNREILGEDLNAGAEIMAAMRAHPTNVGVQENACKALKNLAFHGYVFLILMEAGANWYVSKAHEEFPSSKICQEALERLC